MDHLIFLIGLGLRLELFHASIKDFPLVDLKRKLNGNRGLSTYTFGSDGVIHSLTLSIIVVEFISEGLFNHGNIIYYTSWIFGFLLTFSLIDHILFCIVNFFLNSSFITIFQNQISFKIEMDLKLGDLVIFHHFSIFERKVAVIFRGLRVDWL